MNILLKGKERPRYSVAFSDIPLMKDAIKRIDNLHKRLLISIILPVISLIVSIVALLVQ